MYLFVEFLPQCGAQMWRGENSNLNISFVKRKSTMETCWHANGRELEHEFIRWNMSQIKESL